MKCRKTYIMLTGIVLSIAAICIFASCTTTQIAPSLNIEHPDNYKQHQEQEGLAIAIHPIVNRKEMFSYFNDDLFSKGILPVLIVAENKNKTQTYLISSDQVFLKDDSAGSTVIASSVDTRKTTYEKSYKGIGVVLVGGPMFLPFAFLDWGPSEHSKIVQHNIVSKALQRKSLSPNQIHSGCIYLTLPQNNSTATATLVLISERINGESPLRFDFALDIPYNTLEGNK